MHLSVDELREKVEEFRSSGLNTQQIADELSLSQTTVQWLSASDFEVDEKPVDVKVGWRSIAVKGDRIEAISYVFCDIIEEMVGEEIDTIVGVSINGIAFAQAVSSILDLELSVVRSINEDVSGHLSQVYAGVEGKRVVIIDDVYSSGKTMKKISGDLTKAGAEVKLCMVLVNKSWDDDVGGFPLRALVRAATV
ncbi:MAG: orotate phosphoribosyltransferase-like protein [Euryarchaeota archaeon]|nr:orotate phosphoribosyltransferase-like protein [Euryarchaeota archaeon]MBJ28852.1 orotate phosphoribosyltransferase-like protein [Euryarchaeota archaeon]|tara:strand:- start:1188 stop:1769 length:582 start_codon:yes stop_codon:yes gene_type:complete